MNALERFREGRLREALDAQRQLVSERPDDPAARLALMELLLFNGELETVREQLLHLPRQLPGMDDFLQSYEMLLDAETARQSLGSDGQPAFLMEAPPHFEFRLQALDALRRRDMAAAVALLDEADAACPWLSGHIDGREFDGARDTDDLFGPILEILIDDQYAWFPFEAIGQLRIAPLESLRDYYFVPARLRSRRGEVWQVHLPSLYVGSHQHPDELLRTGHRTDWVADDDGPTRGVGLRLLMFGDEELSFFDFTQWEA